MNNASHVNIYKFDIDKKCCSRWGLLLVHWFDGHIFGWQINVWNSGDWINLRVNQILSEPSPSSPFFLFFYSYL